jgi:hypothetical protein
MVRGHLLEIADHETGFYLLENLGERLSTLIEVDELSRDIIDFLGQPG